MDDPMATFAVAVFFGGSSGGLISWWVKSSIENSWKDRARQLDARVAAQAKETEQLRAHVLHVRSDRRRRFDAEEEKAARAFAAECRKRARETLQNLFQDLPVAQYYAALDGLLERSEECVALVSPEVKTQVLTLHASVTQLASAVSLISRNHELPDTVDPELVVHMVFIEAERLEDLVKPPQLPILTAPPKDEERRALTSGDGSGHLLEP